MKVNVDEYLRLIAQKARASWYRLPAQHKAWIDLDDLIQDGILFARFYVAPRFRPHRAGFCTFLSTSLENFYKEKVFALYRRKRNDCSTVPLAAVQYCLPSYEQTEDEIAAVESLLKVAQKASPILKKYLKHWLLSQKKVCCNNRRFERVRGELLVLGNLYGFGREEMSFLLHNDSWKKAPAVRRKLA